MTYRAAMQAEPDIGDAAGRNSPLQLHGAIRERNNSEAYSDILAMKLRLQQLENENLALKTQVNQLIMSLSKTLLRGAVKS